MSDQTREVQRLFLAESDRLRGFILSLTGNVELAEDIFQEVFLVIWDKADQFELGTNFRAWVRAISHNKVLEALRSRRSGGQCHSPEVVEALAQTAERIDGEFDEHRDVLQGCLERIAVRARSILDLCYVDGLRPSQIARRLRWKATAVSSSLTKTRRFLRDCVERTMQRGEA